jgi:hypothetical protein
MTFRAIETGERRAPRPAQAALPVLRWLAIDDLVIDEDYQRPLTKGSWTQIVRIAGAFDWAHFLPVLVAPSPIEGKYSVIDGQHRTHAARMAGLEQVPALVVDLDEVGQARAFAAVNGLVTAVTPGTVFRAGLRAGEAWALATEAAVLKAGAKLSDYRPSSRDIKPGTVYCVGFIRSEVERGRGALVTQVLDAVRRSDSAGDIYAWSRPFLRPMILALVAVPRAQRRDLAAFLNEWPPVDTERRVAMLKRQSPDPAVRAKTLTALMVDVIVAMLTRWVAEGGRA